IPIIDRGSCSSLEGSSAPNSRQASLSMWPDFGLEACRGKQLDLRYAEQRPHPWPAHQSSRSLANASLSGSDAVFSGQPSSPVLAHRDRSDRSRGGLVSEVEPT